MIRGVSKDVWKVAFHTANVIAFMLGASIASAIHLYTNWSLLVVAAIFDFLGGIYFFTLREDMIESIRDSLSK